MIEIKHRHTGAVLYTSGGESLRDAVMQAARDRADLRGSDLSGSDLRGSDLSFADLRGSDLRGAYLYGNRLVGERPLLLIGPIGSRDDYLSAWLADAGVMVTAGCFHGTLDEFRAAVEATHGNNEHGREYAAAIAMIEAHAAVWAEPAVAEAA